MARIAPPLAFAVCSFIWGTTWYAIKVGYGGLDAVWGASLRFLIAAFIAALLMVGRGQSWPRERRAYVVIATVGLILFGADYGLIYWGEQWLPSGLTAILFATMPLFIALFTEILNPKERPSAAHLLGVFIGIAGLGVIFAPELAPGAGALGPSIAIVASAACAAVSSLIVRRWGRDLAPFALNAGGMYVGAVALAAASLLLGERPSLPTTGAAWLSLSYLVLFGSVVSFILYWDLLKVWGANRAGLVPIVTPVVAVITGLLVGERLTILQWVGSAIVMGGVALALKPKTAAVVPGPTAGAAK